MDLSYVDNLLLQHSSDMCPYCSNIQATCVRYDIISANVLSENNIYITLKFLKVRSRLPGFCFHSLPQAGIQVVARASVPGEAELEKELLLDPCGC